MSASRGSSSRRRSSRREASTGNGAAGSSAATPIPRRRRPAARPSRREDRSFVPLHHVRTLSCLGEHLGADEHFYTMTSEGSWYYFTGRPCPSRFLMPWTALPPFFQEEVAPHLETRRVKFVLYRSDSWAFRIDGIPVVDRLPILDGYIRGHYRFDVSIDGNELWVRENGPPGRVPGYRSNAVD